MIAYQSKMYKQKPDGSYEVIKDVVHDMTLLNELNGKLDELQLIYDKHKENVNNILNNNNILGGSVIFIDLAGNEFGSDIKNKSEMKQQNDERNAINLGLMSLKGVFVAKNKGKSHIPYRNAEITKALKVHLKGKYSKAIMISNVSSSLNHINKTKKTLQYAQLVAQHK